MTTAVAWQDDLVRRKACGEAVTWAQAYPTLQAAWDACERADWLLWYVEALDGTCSPRLRLCACDCARTALKYVPVGEDRPRLAIECAERYARGEATAQELAAASAAAWAAASAAAWAAARDAAWAAASAAAWAAASAAAWAAARAAAGDAACAAAIAAAWDAAHREMCALIRARVPTPAMTARRSSTWQTNRRLGRSRWRAGTRR